MGERWEGSALLGREVAALGIDKTSTGPSKGVKGKGIPGRLEGNRQQVCKLFAVAN